MKKFLIAAFAVFTLAQCTEEEIVPAQTEVGPGKTAELPIQATGSMTISGIFTTYEDVEDCKTCTFVVPAEAAVVDGKELNLKAGSVICLDKAIQYGDIDFVNLEGTEENPIKIGSAKFN